MDVSQQHWINVELTHNISFKIIVPSSIPLQINDVNDLPTRDWLVPGEKLIIFVEMSRCISALDEFSFYCEVTEAQTTSQIKTKPKEKQKTKKEIQDESLILYTQPLIRTPSLQKSPKTSKKSPEIDPQKESFKNLVEFAKSFQISEKSQSQSLIKSTSISSLKEEIESEIQPIPKSPKNKSTKGLYFIRSDSIDELLELDNKVNKNSVKNLKKTDKKITNKNINKKMNKKIDRKPKINLKLTDSDDLTIGDLRSDDDSADLIKYENDFQGLQIDDSIKDDDLNQNDNDYFDNLNDDDDDLIIKNRNDLDISDNIIEFTEPDISADDEEESVVNEEIVAKLNKNFVEEEEESGENESQKPDDGDGTYTLAAAKDIGCQTEFLTIGQVIKAMGKNIKSNNDTTEFEEYNSEITDISLVIGHNLEDLRIEK